MTHLTLSVAHEDDEYVIYLTGRRATLVNWIGQRLPLGRPWARVAVVALALTMGAQRVPTAPYSDPDECAAYYQGYLASYHDEPMRPSEYSNAYTRGYWEGKR